MSRTPPHKSTPHPSSLNILFLSTTIPYPPVDGHSQRTYYLLKHLAERQRIHLIGFVKKPADWEAARVVGKFCASVYPFALPEDLSRLRLGVSLIRNLLSPNPFVVQKYFHAPACKAIEKIFQTEQIDLIHCDMPNLIVYSGAKNAPPSVTVHHDLEWTLMDRRAQMESSACKKWYFSWQAQKWQYFLRAIERKTRCHVVVSEVDRQELKKISPLNLPVQVVPNGVDVDYFQPQPAIPTEKMVLFIGGMHVFQNADAVGYFLESVWPKIQELEKGVQGLIIGQDPSPQLQNLAAKTGAQMTGFVEDVRPFLARAGVMVVPIRIGSGTRLKILAAMAMAKAVVSTSIGCEGIEAKHGQELLVADTPQAMAHQVVQTLRNPGLQKRLGENARRLVEEKYSWARIACIMEGVYKEAIIR